MICFSSSVSNWPNHWRKVSPHHKGWTRNQRTNLTALSPWYELGLTEARKLMFTHGLKALEIWMHPTNLAGPVPAYKTWTACCSFYLEAVSLQRSPHSKCKWMGLAMECQNQGMDAILDQSTRCQPWMHTATPLWMLSCIQGQLQVP